MNSISYPDPPLDRHLFPLARRGSSTQDCLATKLLSGSRGPFSYFCSGHPVVSRLDRNWMVGNATVVVVERASAAKRHWVLANRPNPSVFRPTCIDLTVPTCRQVTNSPTDQSVGQICIYSLNFQLRKQKIFIPLKWTFFKSHYLYIGLEELLIRLHIKQSNPVDKRFNGICCR